MKLPDSGYIWMNGEFIDWQKAQVHVMAHVLHYGTSWFEGIRSYKIGNRHAIFRLREHIVRLQRSMRIYYTDMPYSVEEWENACLEIIRKNKYEEHPSCYLRPIVYRGYYEMGISPLNCPLESVIGAWPMGAYLGEAAVRGANVSISSWNRLPPNVMPAVSKAGGNYMNAQLMKVEATRGGFDEALTLDTHGYIAEASGANIFLVQDGVLYTPDFGDSILPGITRNTVMTLAKELGIPVRESQIPRGMAYTAEEMFFAGTAIEINFIRSVDKVTIGDGTMGPITKKLKGAFAEVTQKGNDPHGWLTYL